MRHRGILDTGPLVAFLKKEEQQHAWAVTVLSQFAPPLFTCEAVLSEACFLVRGFAGGPESVVELVNRGWLQVPFRVQDEAPRIQALMKRYANVPMSYADACLVRMAEQNRDAEIITNDKDFRTYRMNGRQMIPLSMP